jgi:hypothetical protein
MSEKQRNHASDREHYLGIGMATGMAIMAPLGVVLFIVLDNPGMLGVGPGMGVAIGVAIGESLYRRHCERDG